MPQTPSLNLVCFGNLTERSRGRVYHAPATRNPARARGAACGGAQPAGISAGPTREIMTDARRMLLPAEGIVLAAGAHDALSAKLAEEAGFDAIWASGFGISAVQAVPDANILTLTETLEAVRRIVDAVGIPVIADCDNGYGNAINVMRTAGEFERAGAAGICIEDNEFPKRCSFYAGVRRDLVPVEEHARKIEAAAAARRTRGSW